MFSWMKAHKIWTAVIGIALIGMIAGIAGGAGGGSKPAAASTSAPAAPTTQAPAPVATTPAAPQNTVYKYSGTGNWSSPTFNIPDDVSSVVVTYSYSGNIMAGEYSGNIMAGESEGDNMIADIQSSSDDQSIVNTIGVSGGTTTTVYPTPGGDNAYHLSVTATGSWSFTITVTPST